MDVDRIHKDKTHDKTSVQQFSSHKADDLCDLFVVGVSSHTQEKQLLSITILFSTKGVVM